MVGLLCAAVLALIMGGLLYYNYAGWTQLQAVADMQRDGALAMKTLTRVIRGGTVANMQWVGASSCLVVNTTNHAEGWRFTKTGDRLVYTVSGGSNMNLVRKGLAGFSCVLTTSNVVFWLSLRESSLNASMNLTNTIYPRN